MPVSVLGARDNEVKITLYLPSWNFFSNIRLMGVLITGFTVGKIAGYFTVVKLSTLRHIVLWFLTNLYSHVTSTTIKLQ